jgi:hypothetical protein
MGPLLMVAKTTERDVPAALRASIADRGRWLVTRAAKWRRFGHGRPLRPVQAMRLAILEVERGLRHNCWLLKALDFAGHP